jgi:hypothetical protein
MTNILRLQSKGYARRKLCLEMVGNYLKRLNEKGWVVFVVWPGNTMLCGAETPPYQGFTFTKRRKRAHSAIDRQAVQVLIRAVVFETASGRFLM